jgi:surface protein
MALRATIYARSKSKPFVSTWKTDNLSTGSSTTTQVKLPLVSSGTYNMRVDWGDGTTSNITTWNVGNTHTYTVAGTYQIIIKGKCIGWQFNNGGDRLKILSVQKWGGLRLGNISSVFNGCANLNLTAVEDVLNLTGTSTLERLFQACTSLTVVNRINEWDTSGINSMLGTFYGCSSFNQSLSNWNVSNVTTFGNSTSNNVGMFENCTLFNQNLNSWNVSKGTNFITMFSGCTNFNNGLTSGVSGVMSWTLNTTNNIGAYGMFRSSWDVSSVVDFTGMFQGATIFNNGLASGVSGILPWTINTTSNVSMQSMFQSATSFNCALPWNMSKVTTIASMFQSATKFNQNLNSWTLSICNSFASTFNGATNFNNGLASGVAGNMFWNFSGITTTNSMFRLATAFNQNLGILNLPVCSDFISMFNGANKFNNGGSTDINSWVLKTTGTIDFGSIFNGASLFNQPLNLWNTIAVTNMFQMFSSASIFNQPIGSWDTSNVINISQMFANALLFNQPLNGWVTSLVNNMSNTFSNAQSFNQPLNSWVTNSVTNMLNMFANCPFNQDIGMWNVSNVTNFTTFMSGKTPATFSAANLDAIYNGWSSRPVQPNLTITFGTAKYTLAGQAGRDILDFAPNNWTITDGGI